MSYVNDLVLKTTIKIDDQSFNFELFTIIKGSVKAIKLNDDVFALNNGSIQQNETDTIIQEKKCSRCKKIKPVTDFYKNNFDPSGYQTYCKECAYITNKKYKKKHKKNKTKETEKKQDKRSFNKGRPILQNTKLIQWIDKKGKFPWTLDDFFKQYPECYQNKGRYFKQISQLIELHKIIQLDNKSFRRNI